MSLPPLFRNMRLPVIASPMFIVSGPELVIAQCKAGIVGSFPALNARPASQFDEWLHQITEELAAHDRAHPDRPAAPFAVNQIVHKTNARLDQDMAIAEKWRVPLTITSLGAREDVYHAAHGWGGIVLHDVIDNRFAHKAVDKGADGLIAVAAGAGGHAGVQSPLALIQEIRAWFPGLLALSGAIACGRSILAAQAMGADFAYMGSTWIATEEAHAVPGYKQAVVEGDASGIVYTDLFSGVPANYLRSSIVQSGLDPDNLPGKEPNAMHFGSDTAITAKAWRDIWGAGQGIGAVHAVEPVAKRVETLAAEYAQARAELAERTRPFA